MKKITLCLTIGLAYVTTYGMEGEKSPLLTHKPKENPANQLINTTFSDSITSNVKKLTQNFNNQEINYVEILKNIIDCIPNETQYDHIKQSLKSKNIKIKQDNFYDLYLSAILSSTCQSLHKEDKKYTLCYSVYLIAKKYNLKNTTNEAKTLCTDLQKNYPDLTKKIKETAKKIHSETATTGLAKTGML